MTLTSRARPTALREWGAPDLALLGGQPHDVALVTAERTFTYADLEARVGERVAQLGADRRLLLLEMGNDLDSVLTYLAAVAGGHPVILVPPGEPERHQSILERYAPQAPFATAGENAHLDLHPDLAVLLSTSGSTGSPKLVRLSRGNVLANAASIADYLGLSPDDCAITSLPLHYCYGLSVLNSHLIAGATIVLTDLSVTTDCFWALAREHRVTGIAGVPYTFDLLDSSGFAEREVPSLRYLTQAGGRMDPGHVRRYAELGEQRGWDLVVMYGQTEATARMAYLPPELARSRPTAVGVPIPGGHLRLDPGPGIASPDGGADRAWPDGVGELVYSGPNVMMGYAEDRADLARGSELTELRTGDLGRLAEDGLWEIVGRVGRTAKLFGLRVDMDRVEQQLREVSGHQALVVEAEGRLHVFATGHPRHSTLRHDAARWAGLPASAIRAHVVDELPATGSGKPDRAALLALARAAGARDREPADAGGVEAIRDLYAVVLGRPEADLNDSFVSLGGDSLSFVEISTRLAARLGHLPDRWPETPIRDLPLAGERRRFLRPVAIPVLIRAAAIVLIVLSHTDVLMLMGGAHALLAVAGYQLARISLRTPGRRRRVGRLVGSVGAVVVPASAWIVLCGAVTGEYRPYGALYLNDFVGSDTWTPNWHFWFLEVLVWGFVAAALALSIPALDRLQRTSPFRFAMGAVLLTLAARYATIGVEGDELQKYTVTGALWVLALGWAAAEARTRTHQCVVLVTTVIALQGYFTDQPDRTAVVILAVALLLWSRPVPLPSLIARMIAVIAAASLWIYLTHWQVYYDLEEAGHPLLAVAASLALGIGANLIYSRLVRQIRTRRRGHGPARASDPPMSSW